MASWLTGPVYALYTHRLRRRVRQGPVPRHIGLIMDGNRRWARHKGMVSPSVGHRYGAEHVDDVLEWCRATGIEHVTVFVCSAENLQRRGDEEVAYLMGVIEDVVTERLTKGNEHWRVHIAGSLDVLPDSTAHALKRAVEQTRTREKGHITLAVGYGGRQELVEAMREHLYVNGDKSPRDIAAALTMDDITDRLYTAGRPDPDLVIRTSGEQRMSNFLLWQSAYAELYFCEAYWPAFREVDFLRALRSYAQRQRRHGA
ncbi:polyprenyl diphosphate synthase [Kutzneria chonburiensis]|uniref:Isoprenyl transferase n=1 Tax=Kutzneria chonburiensis TaxID=1483604 RepID=A0ABV6MJR7_9PSEU|nr:polyprenyl diphosphate synthase [Kutzneria chonburiensis]